MRYKYFKDNISYFNFYNKNKDNIKIFSIKFILNCIRVKYERIEEQNER